MRDRLIELLKDAPRLDVLYGKDEEWQMAADHLLANGVIVPPKPRTRHRPDYSAFDTEKMADEAREWHRQNKLFGNTEQLKGGDE